MEVGGIRKRERGTARPGNGGTRTRIHAEKKQPVSPRRDRSGDPQGRGARRRRGPSDKQPGQNPVRGPAGGRAGQNRRSARGHGQEQSLAKMGDVGEQRRGRREYKGGGGLVGAGLKGPADIRPAGTGCRAAVRQNPRGLQGAVMRDRQPEGQQEQREESGQPGHGCVEGRNSPRRCQVPVQGLGGPIGPRGVRPAKVHSRTWRRRRALATTVSELRLMAAPANIGLRSQPVNG